MLRRSFRRFNFLRSLFGYMDTSTPAYQVGTHPVDKALPDEVHTGVLLNQQPGRTRTTALSNGVRILTESSTFPGLVHLGILLDAGTRDESLSHHTDGICFALKNTYMKTNTRTNEQLNYCIVQMSGGDFTMDYDQEKMFYRGNCLAHDTYDYLQMMADAVLDDKTVMDEEAAQWRADEHWKLEDFTSTPDGKINDIWHNVAYGNKGVGMPLEGYQASLHRIGYSHMNEFRKANVVPSGMIVAATGIDHHEEFVEAVRPYFEHLTPVNKPARTPSKYLGGEHREICESDTTYLNLSFEGVSWTSPEMPTAMVLKTLIGDGGGFSTGGPGKGMHSRAYTRILARYQFINSIKSENVCFSDTGHFRILAVGPSSENEMMAYALLQEWIDLMNVTDIEVTRAKNCLKNLVCQTLEKASGRVEDGVKMYHVFGKTSNELDYLKMINSVTTDGVKELVKKMLRSPPTLIVIGGDTHKVPSADKIAELIKKSVG